MVVTVTTRIQDMVQGVDGGITGHHIADEDAVVIDSKLRPCNRWLIRTGNWELKFSPLDVGMNGAIIRQCWKMEMLVGNNLSVRKVVYVFFIRVVGGGMS